MKKITLIALLATAGLYAQLTATPFDTGNSTVKFFGANVAVQGNEILANGVVFTSFTDPTFQKVYVFEKSGNNVNAVASFSPESITANDNFGSFFDIDGDYVVVSAHYQNGVAPLTGAAYVYKKTNGTWDFSQKLTASDAADHDQFSINVALWQDYLFVSSYQTPGTNSSGGVYVYKRNSSGQYEFTQKLTLSGAFHLGQKINVDNGRLVACSEDLANGHRAFHSFTLNGLTWQHEASSGYYGTGSLTAPDFSLGNDEIYVVQTATSNGEVYTLSRNGNVWQTLISFNLQTSYAADFQFAYIMVKGNNIFLSAISHSLPYLGNFRVLQMSKSGNDWNFEEYIEGNGPDSPEDHFGSSMAIDGNLLVVGALQEGVSNPLPPGKAYFLDAQLSVDDASKNDISLYPNPVKNELFVRSSDSQPITKVQVWSVTGALLLESVPVSDKISIEGLASGVYIATFFSADGNTITKRLIKQ